MKAAGTTNYFIFLYDEATDAVSAIQDPHPAGSGHGYDHTMILNGILYIGRYADTEVDTYDVLANSFGASIQDFTITPRVTRAMVEYEGNGISGLFAASSANGGKVEFWNASTQSWGVLQAPGGGDWAFGGLGNYHNVSAFNPIAKVALILGGNGSNQAWKLWRDGSSWQRADLTSGVAVSGFNVTNNNQNQSTIVLPNPNNRKFIVHTYNGTIYEWDAGSDTVSANQWTIIPNNSTHFNDGSNNLKWGFGATDFENKVQLLVKNPGADEAYLEIYKPPL
jgi:hypothetical protein